MPEKYGNWVEGLGNVDITYALLGLGLVPSQLHQKPAAALADVAETLTQDEVHTWRFDAKPTPAQWEKFPPAAALANLVKSAAATRTQRFGLLNSATVSALDLCNLVRHAIPPEQVAIHVLCGPSQRQVRFRWPLRVGFLPGPLAESEMARLMSMDSWNRNVYDAFVLSRRSPECDLLICPAGLMDAKELIERTAREIGAVRADVVAVFPPHGESADGLLLRLEDIRTAADAGGVAWFDSGQDAPTTNIRNLSMGLSHRLSLDVALAQLTGTPALLMASSQLLDASDLGLKTDRLATALGTSAQARIPLDPAKFGRWGTAAAPTPAPRAEPVLEKVEEVARRGARRGGHPGPRPPPKIDVTPPPPPPMAAPETARPTQRAKPPQSQPPQPPPPPPPPTSTRGHISRYLRRTARAMPWHSESGDASDLGTVMRSLAEEDEQKSGVRYLQAAFASPKKPDVPLAGALKPETGYLVNVFVGQQRKGYARTDVAFPDLPPPDDGRANELEVVFWEPKLCPKPVVQKLDLPPLGSSQVCHFELRTRKATKAINARISILHRNRVLQTGTLKAAVGRRGEVVFELDAIPRRILSGLDQRTNFSMAMVLNDTDGEGAVHVMSDGKAQTFKTGDPAIGDLVNAIGAAISDITASPANYQGLRAAGSVELLRKLAVKGSLLREYLERYSVTGGKLVTPEYVQLVSTKPGKVFPLEFIYDWKKPKLGATLCAHAEAALAAGDCLPACARHADPAAMGTTVCPFGFWGLRCVIERKLHDNKESAGKKRKPGSSEPVSGSRTVLKPLSSVLVGATPKADAVVATSVADMLKRIRKIDAKAPQVSDWAKWPAEVKRAKPATLALVVHQDVDAAGTPEIEIGPPPLLSSDDLDDEYVCEPDSAAPPIVLLIGCETGKANITYENFALRFQWRGAAIVVSTIAEVVGRQAAPMAADILEAIHAVKKPTSFAVVMRDVRRNLLAQGTPMVLGLVADGDADWDIVGS